ncbi:MULTISPECIES: threonine/homoserine exporter RhtA [Dickeya]|uniref:DMT superfamily metabolite efflux protein n=1 Tax=Dickeya aquatica TaxID=1401087 RepID=A0A375AAP2_9GAMM|nr:MULTISPECIES: threonine/homoserine exporter RhtA [Dickeya]SLM62669.1 Putative DMT superfamily metabolite efflux protein precursor [Dickeya aquatica]
MTLIASLKNTVLLPVLLIVIAMLSIQSGAALAKTVFPLTGASGMTALRLAIGTLILLLVFKPWRRRVGSARLPLLVYGITLGGMNYLFYLALRTVPLGIVVALEFTGPLAVALISSRRVPDFIWVLLAATGLWLLLPLGQHADNLDLAGVAFAVGAGACWAGYILFGQKAGASHGASTVALGSLIAALVYCPLGLMFSDIRVLLSFDVLPMGIAVALLSTALPYSLEMLALTRLPARTFSTLMSLEPAIAALSGIVFLHEQLSALQWLALACIIAASLGITLTVKQKPTPAG